MPLSSDCPEKLLSVANEIEASAIVSALAEYGIEAFAAGGYTSGFKAEAPGSIALLVKRADLDRAQQALAQIQQPQDEIDWDNVDVMEGAEEESQPAETAAAEPDWGANPSRLWWVVALLTISIGAIVGLFMRYGLR